MIKEPSLPKEIKEVVIDNIPMTPIENAIVEIKEI